MVAVLAVTLVCAALQTGWNSQMPEKMHLGTGFAMLGCFAVLTVVVHLVLLNSLKGSPAGFVRVFMGATAFKFMLYLLVLIVFFLYSGDNKQALVLHFLFFYLVFTVLEVTMLQSELNRRKGENKAP